MDNTLEGVRKSNLDLLNIHGEAMALAISEIKQHFLNAQDFVNLQKLKLLEEKYEKRAT